MRTIAVTVAALILTSILLAGPTTQPKAAPATQPATQPTTRPAAPTRDEITAAIKAGKLIAGMDLTSANAAMKATGTTDPKANTITWTKREARKGITDIPSRQGLRKEIVIWEITTIATLEKLKIATFKTSEKRIAFTGNPWLDP